MIYHKICPLCQNVCVREMHENFGSCKHENLNFYYNFVESDGSTIIDIVVNDNYVMIELAESKKNCYIRSDSREVIIEAVPFNWNNFELDSFEKKIKKILELKTFV